MADMSQNRSRDALVSLLTENGAQFKGNSCRCIFHDDKHASAGVYVKDDVWRFKCQVCDVGGDVFDMKARLENKPLVDVLPHDNARRMPEKPRTPLPTYPTLDALVLSIKGRVEAQHRYSDTVYTIRYIPEGEDRKKFKHVHSEGGRWVMTAPPKLWLLYGRDNIGDNEYPIIVVEGEKCVDAIRAIGLTAISSASGAGNSKESDWTPLAGHDCVLWEDNDEPGAKHMDQVADILLKLNPPARVRRVDIKRLKMEEKGDVADFLKAMDGQDTETKRAAILRICADSITASPVGELFAIFEDTISGKRQAVPTSWVKVNSLSRPFIPGCITFLCGAPGCGKSFLLLEAAKFIHARNIKIALFMLEENTSYHLHRLVAQLSETADMLDPDWMKKNPERARNILEMYREELDDFAPVISDVPNDTPTIENLLTWARNKAKTGCRVIGIDPISVANMGPHPWDTAGQFMNEAKRIAVEFDTSIIVTVHPRKGTSENGIVNLDSVSGGAAFTRLSQTVLWIERHADDHLATLANSGGFPMQVTSNRTLHILKSRNGPGQGARLAFNFDANTLRFQELGLLANEHKQNVFKKQPKQSAYVSEPFREEQDEVPF